MGDLAQVQRLHEDMGIDYAFPDLGSPLFVIRKVAELEGRVVAASVFRIEAETYLWVDRRENPGEMFEIEKEMQKQMLSEAWSMGIECVVAWVPQHVEEKFAKRLKKLGWKRDREGWHSWSQPTEQ